MRKSRFFILPLLLILTGLPLQGQAIDRQFHGTSLSASGFFNGRKPVFYDGQTLYTVDVPYVSAKSKVTLYRIDVPSGTHEGVSLKMPGDLSAKESNLIRDIATTPDGLYMGLSSNIVLHYTRTTKGGYVYAGKIPLPFGIDRMYIVGNTLITEEYYDFHPLDQQEKHVRILIDLATQKIVKTLRLDESAAPYTPVMNHFFDVHPSGRTLTVKSPEMKIMLGTYDQEGHADSIVIERRHPLPCTSVDLLPGSSGEVVANIKTLNELDKTCFERLEKVLFLDTNLILATVNHPANDSNSIINRTKRLIVLKKQGKKWNPVFEETVSLVPPDGSTVYAPLFRAAYLYTNGMEMTASEGKLLFLAYGKIIPPSSPFDAAAYKAYKDSESKKDKAINKNVWLEIVDFTGF